MHSGWSFLIRALSRSLFVSADNSAPLAASGRFQHWREGTWRNENGKAVGERQGGEDAAPPPRLDYRVELDLDHVQNVFECSRLNLHVPHGRHDGGMAHPLHYPLHVDTA